jgi:hypothetical protein
LPLRISGAQVADTLSLSAVLLSNQSALASDRQRQYQRPQQEVNR